jgi:pimeloyl-ACP methyl ester carboxylesterase
VRFFKNSREEDAIVPGMVLDYLSVGLGRIVATARYALRYHIEEQLPKIEAPTLVVHPSKDRIVPREWAKEIADLVPNGQLLEIPDYAHGVERVGVPVLAPLLRRFIDEADRSWVQPPKAA